MRAHGRAEKNGGSLALPLRLLTGVESGPVPQPGKSNCCLMQHILQVYSSSLYFLLNEK
jgi:hypothetical protein